MKDQQGCAARGPAFQPISPPTQCAYYSAPAAGAPATAEAQDGPPCSDEDACPVPGRKRLFWTKLQKPDGINEETESETMAVD